MASDVFIIGIASLGVLGILAMSGFKISLAFRSFKFSFGFEKMFG